MVESRSCEEIAKRLGALPIVGGVLAKLRVRQIIDGLCPIREKVADYTHGQIAEILIANRLTAPHPLYRFDLWAQEFAAPELFGVNAKKLNDDRLGRTLDALADKVDEIQIATSMAAVESYGLSLDKVHLDITSFMFEGAYEEQDADPRLPVVKRGYNAEKDFKRRQVRTGQAVIGDGGIPLYHKVFSGNQTDSTTLMKVFEGLEFLRSKAKPKELIHVGDSKLLSAGNLLFLQQRGVFFVGPGERRHEFDEEVSALDPTAWVELSYASESEVLKRKKAPKEEWNRYWCQEIAASVRDPKTGKEFPYRKLYIRSSEEVRAATKNRDRQMRRTQEELQKVANGIPRYYKTKQQIENKVSSILEARGVAQFIKATVSEHDGRPHLEWHRDELALEKAAKVMGCYPLLTNLSEDRTAKDVLAIQKDQYRVERRFADWKGPLEVCPVFLHSNRRIVGLMLITALALMIFCLIERQVRREIGDKDGYAVGFLGERRKSRPTGSSIFYVLRVLTAITFKGKPGINRVLNIPPLVERILDVFQVNLEQIVS